MAGQNNIDFIRSHVDTFILRALLEKDKYGYEILHEIDASSKGLFSVKQPTLYASLKRLESLGQIRSYDGDVSAGAQRKYYSLTDEGRLFLTKYQEQWEYSRTIINSLLSDKEFNSNTPPPFDATELRPLTRRSTKKINNDVAMTKQPEIEEVVTGKIDLRPLATNELVPLKGEKVSNYINVFDKLYSDTEKQNNAPKTRKASSNETDTQKEPLSLSELKTQFLSDGVKVKIYSGKSASEYYVGKFYNAVKLRKDAFFIAYLFLLIETLIIYFSAGNSIGFTFANMFTVIGSFLLIPLLFLARYLIEPNAQTGWVRANLNIKIAIITSLIVAFNCIIIIILVGFFVYDAGADIKNALRSIIIPTVFMLNIPLTTGIYCLLYKTKRYHIS